MSLRNSEVTNEMIEEGWKYLYKHQILELFEDLTTMLAYERPPDIKDFLIKELKSRKSKGPAGHAVFTDQELKNVFTLFDLRQQGTLSQNQCKEALRTISHSAFQYDKVEEVPIPESVDALTFKQLAYRVLG
mmetsp:Transcript_7831/g.11547  ORF Transcript_7831/g.11547 Transcript_7831/m.11547 type:complete len:132 (+) Transcript_7831:40-435(+)